MKILGLLLLSSILLWAPALQAAPWGALVGDPQENASQPTDRYFILSRAADGQPVRVYLRFSNPEDFSKQAHYKKQIASVYRTWFKQTASFIGKSKRKTEFPRMLARLNRGIKVQFVASPQEADLLFLVEDWPTVQKECLAAELKSTVGACVRFTEGKLPTLHFPREEDFAEEIAKQAPQGWTAQLSHKALWEHSLPHEIGHTLGLSDQYDQMVNMNSHQIYRSTHLKNGMMRDMRAVSCDDADGIINLIDILKGTEISRKQGWHSLCEDSPDVYVDGIAMETGPYVITPEEPSFWSLHTYQANREVAEYTFKLDIPSNPFTPITEQIEQTDALGRPVRARGEHGEQIYYAYNYGKVFRLITKAEHAIRLELSEDSEVAGSMGMSWDSIHQKHIFFAAQDGSLARVSYVGQFARGGYAYYLEGQITDPKLEIGLDFDSGHRVINQSIKGSSVTAAAPVLNQTGSRLEQQVQQVTQNQQIQALVKRLTQWAGQQRPSPLHASR